MRNLRIVTFFIILCTNYLAVAGEYDDRINTHINSKVREWLYNSNIIARVKGQNSAHTALIQADIDKLNVQWKMDVKAGSGALINSVMTNDVSKYLKKIKEDSKDIYIAITVMDNRGINVGQTDPTSDYWQGDKPQWQKTFLVSAEAVFIDQVKFDELTKIYQVQVSMSIKDEKGNAIGAMTITMNPEKL